MTNWKEQINSELGSDKKFHKQLEQQIIARAQQRRRPRQWQLATTLTGICLVVLLLVLTLPREASVTLPERQAAPLLMSERLTEDFDMFYISHVTSKNDQFLARPSAFAYGTKRFTGKDNVQMLSVVLREAQLTEEVINWGARDLIVRFDNGELMKLKLYDHQTWLGLYDVETKLYYMVEGAAAEQLIDVAFERQFNFIQILCLIFALNIPFTFLPKYMKVEQKWKDKAFGVVALVAIPASFILPMWNIILSTWLPMLVLFSYYGWQTMRRQQANEPRNVVMLSAIYTILMPLIWAMIVAIF